MKMLQKKRQDNYLSKKEKLKFSQLKKFMQQRSDKDPLIFYISIGYSNTLAFITKNKDIYKRVKEKLCHDTINLGLSVSGYNYSNGYNFFIYEILDDDLFKSNYRNYMMNLQEEKGLDFNGRIDSFKPKISQRDLHLISVNKLNIAYEYKSFLEEILGVEIL